MALFFSGVIFESTRSHFGFSTRSSSSVVLKNRRSCLIPVSLIPRLHIRWFRITQIPTGMAGIAEALLDDGTPSADAGSAFSSNGAKKPRLDDGTDGKVCFREFQDALQRQQQQMAEMMQCMMSTVKMTEGLVTALSRSGAAEARSALPVAAPDIPASTERMDPKKIPAEVTKLWDAAGLKLQRTMGKYIKARTRKERADEDIAFFEENLAKRDRYPTGVRPFRCPDNQPELDEPWSKSQNGEFTLPIKIPQGSSRKDAMRHVHWYCAYALKKIDAEAQDASMRTHHVGTSKAALFKACDEIAKKAMDRSKAQEMGLVVELSTPIPDQSIKQKVDDLYAKSIENIDKEEKVKAKAAEDEKSKKDQEEKEFVNKAPEDLFKSAVKEVVASMKDDNMGVEEDEKDVTTAKALVKSLTKNGVSPGDGSGQNPKTKTKGKKGKSNGKGKKGGKTGKGNKKGGQSGSQEKQQSWSNHGWRNWRNWHNTKSSWHNAIGKGKGGSSGGYNKGSWQNGKGKRGQWGQ